MREIKFRAWDKVHNKFDSSLLNYIRLSDGAYFYGNADMAGYPVVLMQYTGLKDKNGKEIYEGDVVRFFWSPETGYRVNGEDGATEMIDIVKFEDGCFFFFSDIGSGAFAFRHNENCEVIGNVWETPELLK